MEDVGSSPLDGSDEASGLKLQRIVEIEKIIGKEASTLLVAEYSGLWSDIICTNPLIAHEQNAVDRLWRNAFYRSIGKLRSAIEKAKARQKMSDVADLKKRLQGMVRDGLALYCFLIGNYHSKLRAIADDQMDSSSRDVVVHVLYRLQIYVGDLHRYSQRYDEAESCYMEAVKLSPGQPNAYNQLAVVSHSRDRNMCCVSLYWYLRSLYASSGGDQRLAASNIEILFESNRKLVEKGLNNFPVLSPISDDGNGGKSDSLKAKRASATKSFMVQFVDLQYSFMKLEDIPSARLEETLVSFRFLLMESVFSDALMTKMAVILVAMVEHHKEPPATLKLFSARFAEILSSSIRTRHEKPVKGKPSLRHLVSLGVLFSFLTQKSDFVQGDIKELRENASSIVSLLSGFPQYQSLESSSENDVPKDLKQLMYFQPLQYLWDQASKPEDDYLPQQGTNKQGKKPKVDDEDNGKVKWFKGIVESASSLDTVPDSGEPGYATVGESESVPMAASPNLLSRDSEETGATILPVFGNPTAENTPVELVDIETKVPSAAVKPPPGFEAQAPSNVNFPLASGGVNTPTNNPFMISAPEKETQRPAASSNGLDLTKFLNSGFMSGASSKTAYPYNWS